MAQPGKPKFTFSSKALPEDTFHVVRFRGTEGLSTTYHFDITLLSAKSDLDLTEVLGSSAEFTIRRDDGDIPFHGVLACFEQLQQAGSMVFYRAELVPRVWRLTHTQHNQIFLDKTVKDFLTSVLKDGGLAPGQDVDFRVQASSPAWDYVCQYNESHFNFTSRWMEREGMYFFFDQGSGTDKMVVTDTAGAHAPMAEGEELTYSPTSGLETPYLDEVVSSFMLRQQPMPKIVRLKDYNPDTPSLDIEATAPVSDRGIGEIYIYGEHYRTPSEADRLAKVRAQELLCREKLFMGVSSVPYVRTGYVFTLKKHYRDDFNQRYMTIAATHEGSQEAYLTNGLGLRLSENQDRLYYRNSFTCIPAGVQFRPERNTPLARFQGTMNAKVDAGGSGQYAELDEHGRYKVTLPLDTSGRKDGKATTWLRMAQPYAGSDHGMHFPLHKGTEVLLTFIDGNPDRPIIASAVPNPETPSPVKDANQSQCKITTGGKNKIHMQDKDGAQGIYLSTPTHGTSLYLGSADAAPEDSGDGSGSGDDDTQKQIDDLKEQNAEQQKDIDEQKEEQEKQADEIKDLDDEVHAGEWGFNLSTAKGMKVHVGSENTTILGEKVEIIVGFEEVVKLSQSLDMNIGLANEVLIGGAGSYHWPAHWLLKGSEERAIEEKLEAIGEKQHVVGNELKALGTYDAVRGTWTAVSADVTKIVAASQEVKGEITNATAQVTKALGDRVDAVGNKTEALGNKVKAVANLVGSAGNQLMVAGNCLDTAGSKISTHGSSIKSAGTCVRNAGMMMRDAPIIMDN